MNALPILAALDGPTMIHATLWLLGLAVCLFLVWWLGKYLFGSFGADPAIIKVWTAIFVCLGVLALINFILNLLGYPLVRLP